MQNINKLTSKLLEHNEARKHEAREHLNFEAQELRDLLDLILSVSYPTKTLVRRLTLLTDVEVEQVLKRYQKILSLTEEIDEIISNRATIVKDKCP